MGIKEKEMVNVDSSFQKFDGERKEGNRNFLNTSWHGKDWCHEGPTNAETTNV